MAISKAAARLTLLRWALFQYLIGNSDAHGKNFSFFVRRQGLEPAPWYDLVSAVQYPAIDHELAMAYGDAFSLDEVGAFQLADFAKRCKVEVQTRPRCERRVTSQTVNHLPMAPTRLPSYLRCGWARMVNGLGLGRRGSSATVARMDTASMYCYHAIHGCRGIGP